MENSVVGNLYQSNNECKEIKRRRKIQYRKTKGRLTNGVLNKSICKQNQLSKSLNESKCCNQSQLVSVKNINSFLERNKQLAKALEESRGHMKDLQNEKFTYQMECNQMREKLSIFQNTILKCSCKNSGLNGIENTSARLLNEMESTLQQSLSSLNKYITKLAINKCTDESTLSQENLDKLSVGEPSELSSNVFKETRPVTHNKKTQTLPLQFSNGSKQFVQIRHKKVQVNIRSSSVVVGNENSSCLLKLTENSSSKEFSGKSFFSESESIGSKEFHNKSCQSESESVRSSKVDIADQATQCLLLTENLVASDRKTKAHRAPLAQIDGRSDSNVSVKSILKSNKMLPPKSTNHYKSFKQGNFDIYEDGPDKENKDQMTKNIAYKHPVRNKKVTIYSPAQIRVFHDDIYTDSSENIRLRQRNHNLNYKELKINRKLTKDDPNVDTRFYNSPHKKAKKKRMKRKTKNKMNRSVNLEVLINSVLEESFMSILSK